MRKSLSLWLGFGAMCVGMFMAILDIQVVASSLTTIGAALDIPISRLGWIQTGYLMAEVIAIPMTGLLTRALSLRWMFVIATLGFTLASLGCALSTRFESLIAIRIVQGFCGGMLIPAVFTSVFVMIPEKYHVVATTIAGAFAVVAPTIGPAVGGYLTETYSWHWIFLVNLLPGMIVIAMVVTFVRSGVQDLSTFRRIDYFTIVFASVFLATLELFLSEAPRHNWQGAYIFSLGGICLVSGALGVWRSLTHATPFIDLHRFRNDAFSVGCGLSFVFGFGLYGSVYILSLFLGLVREHTPLAIGEIMMVSGAAQLVMSPVAAILERRVNCRLLTALGFGLFGAGLLANGFTTQQTDFDGLFWPQIMRGFAVMFCLLPATRLALEGWPHEDIPDASGLFNLMRNLGGAIGIAAIDTILQQRTPVHVSAFIARLQQGDPAAARLVGLPVAMFRGHAMGPVDDLTKAMIAPMVRRAAMAESFNEAWFMVAGLFAVSLLVLLCMRRVKQAIPESP
ncbi:MAG TPA: DHA2 family efflux MFS transporter permease subunit [Rhizomicrobium sp.]|nr:DHA2 family efflux MFS transporter permease subunit [Rhizomicrobium sp.]